MLSPLLRALAFIVISSTAHYLAARWLLSVSPAARGHKKVVFAVAGALSLLLAMLRLFGAKAHGAAMSVILATAMIEFAVVMISLLPLGLMALAARSVALAFDAIRPYADDDAKAARISRREALERTIGVSVASVTTAALGWGVVRGRHAFAIEEVSIKIVGWPRALDGYVIAQVSDIHVGAFIGDRELDEGFELVQRVRPDLVVATGDLVDNDPEMIRPLLTRLEAVAARDGAYAILGNHDHYAGARIVADAIRKSTVRLLNNEHVRLRSNDGGGFALLGVDDLRGRNQPWSESAGPDLGQAAATLAPDLPRILLAHQPPYFLESQGRVALQLSGHTHGGQINPGFRPADALMDFVAGRYDRAGSTLYVNRGFGTTGPPSRIAAPPEITKIVIVSG